MKDFVDCDYCENTMDFGRSCIPTLLHNVILYKRIPYKANYKTNPPEYCHDCNVANGQFHHLGCDMERCPICGDQLIGCDCFKEIKE